MAKLKCLPFPFNNKISACAFDLVHMDVQGPYSIPTLDGFKYFLTIVDDATRATWLFSMKSKSIVRLLFQSFYTMVATQFGQNIKSIELIMPKSLTCLISLIPIVLYTNIAVFILHNKILLWRENTSTFFPLQGHYRFSLKFLFNFRVILF